LKRAAGPFEILEILGEGSFGTVCVARVTGDPLRRKVALKILKGAYTRNQKILNRTRDEARLLSRINHPNIVRVERLMDVGGRPVVVMEHVQGVSLDQLLLRFKDGLPASIAVEVTRQTCLALHVAFNEAVGDDGRPLRVIHRDIKPSNILLSIHGEVKVVDFGIAKGEFEGREADTQSVVMGSRPYMAPERLDGISDSPSVDVYSAGMSLFELLSGRTMSLSINPVTHDQAMNRQLAYLSAAGLTPQPLEELRGVVRKMCAYDRDGRPSALDSSRDLEQILYAIDPSHRIGLEEFARTTVLPIYESRPKITPEDAAQNPNNDDEFLREVTGQLTGSNPAKSAGLISWTPYLFVAMLAMMVVVLGMAAGFKYMTTPPTTTHPVVAVDPVPDGRVGVKVFLPPDDTAVAQIGDVTITTSGTVRVPPGNAECDIQWSNGSQTRCRFVAHDGIAISLTARGIQVDAGAIEPCAETAPATVVPGSPIAAPGNAG
jgi:serine/threonine protein kinase